MFVHVVWGRLKEGTWDEYETIYKETVGPTTSQIPGLQRRVLVHGTDDPDEGISLSFWDSAEDLQRYVEGDQLAQLSANFTHLYKDEWWQKSYEVRFDRTAGEA